MEHLTCRHAEGVCREIIPTRDDYRATTGMYLLVERFPNADRPCAPIQLMATNVDDAIAEGKKRFEAWKPGALVVLYHMDSEGDMLRIASWGV